MEERHYIPPITAEAVHIDTVRLSHAFKNSDLPSLVDLAGAKFEINIKTRRDNIIHTANLRPSGGGSNLPYIQVIRSENKYKYSGIKIECSLAKISGFTGLGIQTDDDINFSLGLIADYVQEKIGIDFDARTAKVGRLDVNADFNVGKDRILPYLETLSRPHARLTPSTINHSTQYFTNKSRGFAAYDKEAEMKKQLKEGRVTEEDVLAAEGLLRIEKRLYQPQSVRRFAHSLQLDNEARQLLNKAVATKFISDGIEEMNLDQPKFSTDARNYLLLDHFKKDAAVMLGLLEYRKLLGEDFWEKLDWSKAKYYKRRKTLIAANLWNISPAEALPALVVLADADNNSTSLS